MPVAYSTLRKAGFNKCPQPLTCIMSPEYRAFRYIPCPAAHVHIGHPDNIRLYNKSETLWKIPSLTLSAPDDVLGEDIILASDPRLPKDRPGRGPGAFSELLYPVRIPSIHRLTDAYILLYVGIRNKGSSMGWGGLLTYISEYVDGDGYLDVNRLEPSCRRFWQDYKPGRIPMAQLLDTLESDLAAENSSVQ